MSLKLKQKADGTRTIKNITQTKQAKKGINHQGVVEPTIFILFCQISRTNGEKT